MHTNVDEWIFNNVEEWVIDLAYEDKTGQTIWHASMESLTRFYFMLTWEESQNLGQDRTTMKPRRFHIALDMAQDAMREFDIDEIIEVSYRLRNVNTGETIPMALFA